MTVIYKGNTSVREAPGSPVLDFGTDTTGTRVYLGLFKDLIKIVPRRGAAYADLPVTGLRVVHSVLKPTRAGLAELTVELSTSMGDPATPERTYEVEIEWAPIEKPIETNPKFKDLTDEDFAKLAAWEELPFRATARKKAFQYPANPDNVEPDPKDAAHWAAFDGSALLLAQKKAKRIDSWTAYAPIVTRTMETTQMPGSSSCGKRSTPPVSISGYVFVKTADRAVRSGKRGPWKRIEEWTGAESVDEDLYP